MCSEPIDKYILRPVMNSYDPRMKEQIVLKMHNITWTTMIEMFFNRVCRFFCVNIFSFLINCVYFDR